MVAAADVAVVPDGSQRPERGGGAMRANAMRIHMAARLGGRAKAERQNQCDHGRFDERILRLESCATLAQ